MISLVRCKVELQSEVCHSLSVDNVFSDEQKWAC
jgi:hypothetical protein